MKRIAIFIDGTWNRPDAEHPTNVFRLARCIHHGAPDGVVQHVIYSPGVGAGRGNNRIARWFDKLLGGALGWRLTDIIEDVYRDLVFCYEPGDEIFVFGFSRGAFAARSLVGLIRASGIAPRRHIARIPEAMARYISRDPVTKPDHPDSHLFRADFAPDTATSREEYNWRLARGDIVVPLDIAYLGVWDTVSALGLPAFLPFAKAFNAQYRFHDARLSSMVQSARHAIAIDETRATFPALPWDNMDRLNENMALRAGAVDVPPFQQVWFPGDHGSVGGGGSRLGLSSIALHWVAQGAARAGLSISWEEFDRLSDGFDCVGTPLHNKFGPVGVSGALMSLMSADRKGPAEAMDLALATLDRIWADDGYRPVPLGPLARSVIRLEPAARAALRAEVVARDGGPTHAPGSRIRPRAERAG